MESGHIPARFSIMKICLSFLKCILNENPEAMIYKFLQLQYENPTKGDWASNCTKDLQFLEIDLSLEEIKNIPKVKFHNMLKMSIEKKALQYLLDKQRRKGSDIVYKQLQMSEYLMPNSESLSIEEKRNIFEIRNEMVYIPANFSSSEKIEKCICGEKEDMRHIYYCKYLNKREEEVIPYEEIFKEDVESQSKVDKRFENNFKQREKLINVNNEKNEEIITHAILCDPLSSLLEYSNGNK